MWEAGLRGAPPRGRNCWPSGAGKLPWEEGPSQSPTRRAPLGHRRSSRRPCRGVCWPPGTDLQAGNGEVGLHSACERCTPGCGGRCPESGGCLALEASDFLGLLEPNPGALGTQQSEQGQAPSPVTAWACWPFRCSQGPGSLPEPTLSEPLAPAVEAAGGDLLQSASVPPAPAGPAGPVSGAALCSGQFIWSSYSRSGSSLGPALRGPPRSGCLPTHYQPTAGRGAG